MCEVLYFNLASNEMIAIFGCISVCTKKGVVVCEKNTFATVRRILAPKDLTQYRDGLKMKIDIV